MLKKCQLSSLFSVITLLKKQTKKVPKQQQQKTFAVTRFLQVIFFSVLVSYFFPPRLQPSWCVCEISPYKIEVNQVHKKVRCRIKSR